MSRGPRAGRPGLQARWPERRCAASFSARVWYRFGGGGTDSSKEPFLEVEFPQIGDPTEIRDPWQTSLGRYSTEKLAASELSLQTLATKNLSYMTAGFHNLAVQK